MYGGTAVALRLGHRASVDFDFFTEKPLDRTKIQSTFLFMERSTVLQDLPDTLSVLVPSLATHGRHVKLSFFASLGMGASEIPMLRRTGCFRWLHWMI